MASDEERELFAYWVLRTIGQQAVPSSTEISAFLAMAGTAYDGGLMVIGRAANSWNDGICTDQLGSPDEAEKYAKIVQESVSGDGECPMQWISANWGVKERYNTNRSAFWRCIRRVVHELGISDAGDPTWPSHLVWSNLYKVSPAAGGNPNNTLCEIQLSGCTQLLNLELRTYRPNRVLFLTGYDWAKPFLEAADFKEHERFHYAERTGTLQGAHCVVAVHPQGKSEDDWVRQVVRYFNRKEYHSMEGIAHRR